MAQSKLRIEQDFFKEITTELVKKCQPAIGPVWIWDFPDMDPRATLVFLVLWARIRKFSNYPFRIMMPFQEGAVINYAQANNTQVMFDSQDHYNDFVEFFGSFVDKSTIFNPLPDGLYKSVAVVRFPMGHYDSAIDITTMEEGRLVNEKAIDLFVWLRENCKKPYYRYGEVFFFESEKEAVLFKTTWSRYDER